MNKSFITKRMGTKYQGKSHKQTIIGTASLQLLAFTVAKPIKG